VDDFRKIIQQSRSQWSRYIRTRARPSFHLLYPHQSIELLGILVEAVITEFILDIGEDQNEYGHPNRQAHHIDQRISSMPQKSPESDLEIIPEHFNLLLTQAIIL